MKRFLGLLCWRGLIVALYAFLLAPLVVVLIVSFDTRPYLRFPPEHLSLGSYTAVLHNTGFLHAGLLSILVGAAAAVVSLAVGTGAAFALADQAFPGRTVMQAMFFSPMVVPHIVLAVGLMMTLQPLGLLDTLSGVVIAHVGITLPYVVRIVISGLKGLDPACEEAARLHGATAWQAFWRVTLPGLRATLVAAGLIAFLFSFDEAVIVLFIAGHRATTLPLAIYHYIQFKTDPQVAALSVLVVLASMIPVVIIERGINIRRALAG